MTTPEQSTPNSRADRSGSRSKRTVLLVAVLAVLLVALAYDYAVARPHVDAAYDKIVAENTRINAKSTEAFTNTDVRELLGREPSRTFEDENGDFVEVYSWRRGLPINTHDLYTVFKANGDRKLFYRLAKFQYETSGEVSKFSVPIIVQPAAEDAMDDQAYEQQGGESPAASEPAPQGDLVAPGGLDPVARFAEQDADGDGFLREDEIPANARQDFGAIDTNADGVLSREEVIGRVEAVSGGE